MWNMAKKNLGGKKFENKKYDSFLLFSMPFALVFFAFFTEKFANQNHLFWKFSKK